MSSIAHTQRVISKSSRVGVLVTALATFVVIAAAVFAITHPGGSASRPVPREVGARYVPLIQYHGTGAPLTAAGSSVDPAQPGGPAYIRAEHSYGMVP
jgi:hypothetical protein